ncbi:nitrate reductase molybdenum cofactor assembly chaperone [Alkalilimnicola ehrlichii]|uniref:Nitrate reductase molybdenum cofactor assembly chaperone n=1 Tax=Alkalilimnicola ehrlichii TaxID=351052 RepID=A0A3E0WWJ2_9GAMM|nr:nitrate reductase molybdenum cofactor assembly chaperone [Alkalilimnicola ehrlichii]RFA29942.1 nitrate reductase molybdenum cofactor assembly chaperone [Alkalilimnicola ehrlichii]RFA36531.1 nitrate reductase molybdenum cofactor assembly chaperone [Alkalilimnicola ehrlichii]
MKILKLIATLLHYPEQAPAEYRNACLEVLQEDTLLSAESKQRLAAYVDGMADADLMDLQSRYVETFDRGRAVSLHLFEHVHGESRDRGQAMVDLLDVYRSHGMEVALSELPDYLPLFLEFLSILEPEEIVSWLQEVAHILQVLHLRLSERGSPYAVLFEPLLELGELEPASEVLREQIKAEPRDDTPEAIDEAWAEEPVSFAGMPGGACGSQSDGQVKVVQWGTRARPRVRRTPKETHYGLHQPIPIRVLPVYCSGGVRHREHCPL